MTGPPRDGSLTHELSRGALDWSDNIICTAVEQLRPTFVAPSSLYSLFFSFESFAGVEPNNASKILVPIVGLHACASVLHATRT